MSARFKFLRKDNVIAVVGASNNPEKYGYKVYKALKDFGCEVIPVNPNQKIIQGDKAFPSLKSIPGSVDCVSIITPSEVTEEVVEEAKDKGVDIVWMQPGAESREAIEFCKENNISVIYDECVLVALSEL